MSEVPSHSPPYSYLCPYCDATLRVREAHSGQRGQCNHCGGRIQLPAIAPGELVRATALDPVQAERDASAYPKSIDMGHSSRDAAKPRLHQMPDAQLRMYLMALGEDGELLRPLQRDTLLEMIEEHWGRREEGPPPSERRRAYLLRLGLSPEAIGRIRSEAEAERILEDLHLRPTIPQIEVLKYLEVRGAEMAAVRNRAQADLLIKRLLRV